jgi:hypothetical protein
VLSLAIPWFVRFMVAEPGKPERFLWLWPVQAMFLAVFATAVLPRLGAPRPVVWVTQALLVVTLVGNSFLLSRVDAWRTDGWSGRDAREWKVVDYVAGELDAQGKDRAAIGYRLFIYPFMANYNITNPQYKLGADFDLLFKYRRKITNTDTCAEAFSAQDEYRIVRSRPENADGTLRHYFEVPRNSLFEWCASSVRITCFSKHEELGTEQRSPRVTWAGQETLGRAFFLASCPLFGSTSLACLWSWKIFRRIAASRA